MEISGFRNTAAIISRDGNIHSLFVEENGDHDTYDEDHGEDRPHHPDEPVSTRFNGEMIHVGRRDGIRVGAGRKSLLHTCKEKRFSCVLDEPSHVDTNLSF